MPFLAACPFCRRKVQAPEAAIGQSVACKKCHNYFTLAPEDNVPPEAGARPAHDARAQSNAAAPPVAGNTAATSASAPAAKPGSAPTGSPQTETLKHVAMVTVPDMPRLTQFSPSPERESDEDEWNAWLLTPAVLGAGALLCAILGLLPWLTIALAGVGLIAGVIAWRTTPMESLRDGVLVLLGSAVSAAAFVWAIL
ncbi:MAG: hypothetical protein L0Y71_05685 [Gemmataceae bacterium]|nr:hypothetical protein [Gemmataceae bacterium]